MFRKAMSQGPIITRSISNIDLCFKIVVAIKKKETRHLIKISSNEKRDSKG